MTQSLIRGVSKKKEGTFRKKEWITVFAWTPEDETKKDGVGWLSYFTRPIEEYEKWRDKIGEWAECPPFLGQLKEKYTLEDLNARVQKILRQY